MNRKEEIITRWIDGELNAENRAEFDELMKDDPEFCARVRQQAEGIGNAMRAEISNDVQPPYPDFFNSQIQKRIRQESHQSSAKNSASGFSVLWWLRSPLTWGAAALFMIMFFTRNDERAGGAGSYVVSTYAPDPKVKVERAEYDDDAEATIIMLTGLDPIPDDVEINGRDITAYEPSGSRGGGMFYAGQDNLVFVMERGVEGGPEILVR